MSASRRGSPGWCGGGWPRFIRAKIAACSRVPSSYSRRPVVRPFWSKPDSPPIAPMAPSSRRHKASTKLRARSPTVSSPTCSSLSAGWRSAPVEGRRDEPRRAVAGARAEAAEKAGNGALRHPRSHWADDALALEAEGLARSGACDEAADPISRVRASVTDAALRERVELAAAECAIAAAHPLEADRALAVPLKSKDAGRRSRAEYLAGASAALQLDYGAAAAHFARSQDPVAVAAHASARNAL